LAVSVAITTLAALAACSRGDQRGDQAPAAHQISELPTVTIDELDRMLVAGECQPVDANGEGTRRKLGVIPGAVLLSDSDTFTASELPADKQRRLVFYCANTHCGASHEAASKARAAGYTDVQVLPDGIAGWAKAGKPVDKVGG
jgi:rhodanese-related sulfurtransferase